MSVALQAPHGPPWEFLLVFAVLVGGPRLIEAAKVPGIIGLILGGFLIGPNGLDLIHASDHTVPDLGELGLLYLMFVAGVELDLGLVRAHKRSVVVFSAFTFTIPFVAGTAVGFGLSFDAPAALLLGSLVASHTLVTYPLVKGAGLGPHQAVATAVGATVVTDTLALVVLAAVAGSETGSGGPAAIALELVVGLAVVITGCLLGLPRLGALVFRRLGDDRAVRYAFAIASFLAAAVVGEVFGIEGIVGAFFAGLGLNRLVPNGGPLMERIEFFGGAVFVPVFVVSVGFILDPSVMAERQTLAYAGLFIVACLGGKAAAAWLTRPALGFTSGEAGVVFALTAPQAAATLAATIVGFEIGLFGTTVVNAVLVLILASLVISPLAARRFSRRVEVPEPPAGARGARVLLVATGTDVPDAAIDAAADAAHADGGIVLAVLARLTPEPAHGDTACEELERRLGRRGVDSEVHQVVDDSLAQAVDHAVAAHHATSAVVHDRDGSWRPGTTPTTVPVTVLGAGA